MKPLKPLIVIVTVIACWFLLIRGGSSPNTSAPASSGAQPISQQADDFCARNAIVWGEGNAVKERDYYQHCVDAERRDNERVRQLQGR